MKFRVSEFRCCETAKLLGLMFLVDFNLVFSFIKLEFINSLVVFAFFSRILWWLNRSVDRFTLCSWLNHWLNLRFAFYGKARTNKFKSSNFGSLFERCNQFINQIYFRLFWNDWLCALFIFVLIFRSSRVRACVKIRLRWDTNSTFSNEKINVKITFVLPHEWV